MNMPLSVQASFQGTAQAFIASLANEPWLILAAIITVYIILGVLYEVTFTHHNSLDAAVRRRGRNSRAADHRNGAWRRRPHRNYSAHRHRAKERDYDD